ncbi:MAG TPA: electron transfer flavoprotein-ubiquinone oxidoreductase [Planctomycetota bacterium]|jgi:electron-transferring-flavoprotein dehydrogenase
MPDREVLEVDVLIVGAGPAGLSCAIQLQKLLSTKQGAEPPVIFIIEKGVNTGAHSLSGAVLDPRALNELLPEWKQLGAPLNQPVTEEEILFLTRRKAHRIPSLLIPPYLHNHGNYVVSLGELTQWLAAQAKERGIEILEGVAGGELILENGAVKGVRCADTGRGKDGEPRATFQPGAEIRAKVTVLAEGVRGSLTKQLLGPEPLKIETSPAAFAVHPQTYAIGVKEVWELPVNTFPSGKVVHSLGFPLQTLMPGDGATAGTEAGATTGAEAGATTEGFGRTRSNSFGGSFIYGLDATHLVLGLVIGLDYADPTLDPHHEFNRLKTHPYVRGLIEKGKLISYGAKAIPEGGLYSMPRCYGDGYCILGDSASFLNAARLKGIHLAMKSGMLAAEAIDEALGQSDFSLKQLARFDELFRKSWAYKELYKVRNWRAGYARGLVAGAIHDLAQRLTGGRGLRDPLRVQSDAATMERLSQFNGTPHGQSGGANDRSASLPVPHARLTPDGKLTFDKVTDVYHSGTNHTEDQPCHLKVPDLALCVDRCTQEFGNPCQNFCPAGVYEWITAGTDSAAAPPPGATGKGHLQINAGNCVHCKTCDIKDPYGNIVWTVPEGGGGPRYQKM